MYLIIVGLGGIGRSLAGIASESGHSVVVIDKDEDRCADILSQHDLLAIAGNATDKAILEDAGIDRADALVATTSDDALNLMACWLAKKYAVKTLVSIVNQKEHSDLFKEVGVRISENPDEIVARSLYLWSENPDTQLLASIEGGSIFEVTASEGAKGVNKTVKDVSDMKNMLYIAIRRGGQTDHPKRKCDLYAGRCNYRVHKKGVRGEIGRVYGRTFPLNIFLRLFFKKRCHIGGNPPHRL